MNNNLNNGSVEVKGDCSRNDGEVSSYLSIKLSGEEVFHQGDRDMSSVSTSRGPSNLDGEDGCEPKCLVQSISEFKRGFG